MRYVVCDDFGKTVNPLIVRGQVAGGVAQGYGQAVLEHTVYDPEFGPAAVRQLHGLRAAARRTSCRTSRSNCWKSPAQPIRSGVKGAGEAGAVGSPPALINAIIDALRGDGVTQIDMPATPERVWRALAMAKAA